MIYREITPELNTLLNEYPVITILGPRQAGKTTLAKENLKNYDYSNLEAPEEREFAQLDPKAYLTQFKSNVIIDEIQRVPELLSYIQVIVDTKKQNGQFVLTGSHQLKLQEAISQSLAGRTAILNLLPFSISELSQTQLKKDTFEEYAISGFMPRIYDQNQRPTTAYSNYYQTYIERDLRQLITVKDLGLFSKFFKLLAGRVGQLLDLSSLANDVGVDSKTISKWISILEASFIIFKLRPYYENFGKRVIKSPKYYFTDIGLLCFILGITKESQVTRDPLVGNIFENAVVIECLKKFYNLGKQAELYFFRDSNGNEVDILIKNGRSFLPIEVKSSSTFTGKQLKGLKYFEKLNPNTEQFILCYNGENKRLSNGYSAVNFKSISETINQFF